ncbi:P1 family peptidase, partial [bacterium]|nr:P1 family peptidase [bacterium]
MNIELLYKSRSGEREILISALLPKIIDYTRNFRIHQKTWLFISLVLFSIVSCSSYDSFAGQQVENPAALKADEGAIVPKGRARARDLGIKIGIYETGRYNAITDVAGVKVGHVTLNSGDSVRTGVTAIIPRDDIWINKLFAASYIINGNGEATGIAWINEAGWIEA